MGYCSEVRKDPDQTESLHRLSQMEAEAKGQSDQKRHKKLPEARFLILPCQLGTSLQKNNDQEKWHKDNLEIKDVFGLLDTVEST